MEDFSTPTLSSTRVWIGMIGSPAVWGVHFMLVWALVEGGCAVGIGEQRLLGGNAVQVTVLVATVIALLLTAASGVIAYGNWQRARMINTNVGGIAARAAERTNFLALVGLSFTVIFFVVIVFTALPVFVLPPCDVLHGVMIVADLRVSKIVLWALGVMMCLCACAGGDSSATEEAPEAASATEPAAIGSIDRGEQHILNYGCGACHTIPGISGADNLVGPPLTSFSRRSYVAGVLPNTPENLIAWIQNPHAVQPDTVMPNLGVSEADARDIAAYLLSLD